MIVKRRAVSNLAVIRSLNFVFLLVFSLAGIGHVLPLDDSPYTGGYNQEIESGRTLMQLKHIPEGDQNLPGLEWILPSLIDVTGVTYRVSFDLPDFKIISPNGVTVAQGDVMRMSNAKFARVCGFGRRASSNLGVLGVAAQTCVRVLDPATNGIYVASLLNSPKVEEVLVYKNVLMTISGTNRFDFACRLMNAGLPSGEPHLPISSRYEK